MMFELIGAIFLPITALKVSEIRDRRRDSFDQSVQSTGKRSDLGTTRLSPKVGLAVCSYLVLVLVEKLPRMPDRKLVVHAWIPSC